MYILDMLFPEASTAFVDELAQIYTQSLLLTTEVISHGQVWHDLAGQGIQRLNIMYMDKAGELIQSYVGAQRMEQLVRNTNGALTEKEISTISKIPSHCFIVFGQILFKVADERIAISLNRPETQ